ncbi:cysteine desulfurase [Rubricoccus marinus]|uniref:cysteine desulfurase n=1 Tax=Rubricoccus marinus TaxID=716817 RepID=A0A259TY23_9BACT|nr:cysteine desulfurase [Rubricoccus marinus]OZC02675.1 cysteine sulfinate desulfinase [Rubricoccus marinus]
MTAHTAPFDVDRVRADFPILTREVHGKPLVYLDNAATTQKPRAVLDRLARYYSHENANVHRGVHFLSADGTEHYEEARRSVQRFVGAEHAREVVFTRGTTESINLVAHGFARGGFLASGDEILVSALEHHANVVPWQMAAEVTGATLRVIPMTDRGDLDLTDLDSLINERTRIVAVTHTSNALGTVTPLAKIIAAARAMDVPVLVDGAQATPHAAVDVQALGADFFVFSSHKTYGPTGIGVLWGREAWLDKLPPYQGGGDMIENVTFEKTTYTGLPGKFEAGTPHVAGGIGLGAAVEYLMDLGMENVAAHEADLVSYAEAQLGAVEGLTFVGTPEARASAISFLLDGIHPYDAGTVLDRLGIAVRTGQHCAQPVMDRLGVPGTVRASFGLYNTRAEVDVLIDGLSRVRTLFG